MVYQLTFVATREDADATTGAEALNRLYEASCDFERQGLTGLFLHHGDRLLYCMEGEEEDVSAEYEKVKGRPGTTAVAVLRQRHVESRSFSRWAFALDDDPRTEAGATLEDRVVVLVRGAPPEIRQTFLAFAKLNAGRRVV